MILLKGEILWHLVWVLPLLAILFLAAWKKRRTFLSAFLGKRADDPRFVTLSKGARIFRFLLFCGIVFFLFLAAARPSWGMQILPYTSSGRDLMIVFDTSKSMLAQDVRPSRLAHAKWLASQLALKNPGDRFGLIAFAGRAFLECPLTIDRTSFIQSVEELNTDSIPVGGTNLEQAISMALKGFSAAEGATRAIILITDGDELIGDSGKSVNEAIKLKIPLFILGVGDPSQPSIIQIPDSKGNVKTLKDSKGNIVNSPLNEKQLTLLARKTGGIYVRSTTTDSGLSEIQARIRKLDAKQNDTGKQTRPIERPLYPLGAAFLLLCLWLVIPEKRLRLPGKKLSLLLLLVLPGFSQGAEAEKTVEKELPARELFNQAIQLQKEGKEQKTAERLYEQVIAKAGKDMELRGRAFLNLGVFSHETARNSLKKSEDLLQKQQLDPALKELESSLKEMKRTEEHYRNALLEMSAADVPAQNQQLLLSDRKTAEELKKKIEELIKQQQKAQNDTRQAENQQQQQNQQKNQQQKQQQKAQTEKQTQQAQKSVRDLQNQAKELNQKQMEQQAQKAGEELSKAREAQKKDQGEKAQEHLKKAMEQLGNPQDRKDEKKDSKKDQKKDNQGNGDPDQSQNQEKKDQELPQNQKEQKAAGKPEQEKDLDKNQAKALLDMMTQDEKNLKDALKQRMKQNYRIPSVEKDW